MRTTYRVDLGRCTWYIDAEIIDGGSPDSLESPGDPPEIRILSALTDHPTEPGWIHRSAEDLGPKWLERATEAIIQVLLIP